MKLLLFFFATATILLAEQAPERTFRTIYLNAAASAPRELILFDGEDSQKIKLPRMNFSPVYTLRAGTEAIALLESELTEIDKLPPSAPRVRIPEGITDFYLFLTSDSSNPTLPVRMAVVDASIERFESGQMLWFNLTDHTIGGRLGDERILIKPKSRHLMQAPTSDAGHYSVKLAYQMNGQGTAYPINETNWFHDPNNRNVAFVFSNPGLRTPEIAVFPDHRRTIIKSE